jgi:hypothetical protein
MKISPLFVPAIFTVVFAFLLYGCTNQLAGEKSVTNTSAFPTMLERAMKNKRYFIMQSGVNIYTVTSIDLDKRKQQMTVTLDRADSLRVVYFKNPTLTTNQTAGSQAQMHEIHVYMKDSTSYTLDEPHTIPIERVSRIELVD